MKNMQTLSSSTFFSKMLTVALVVVCLASISNTASAKDTDSIENKLPKNTFFVEYAGAANHGSINYMHTFRVGKVVSYSYSVGYGKEGKNFSIPLSINAFTTQGNSHFTAGVGIIPYVEYHQKIKRVDSDKQLYVTPGVGYMYQRHSSGLYFKAGVASQIKIDPPSYNFWAMTVNVIRPTATVSLGFSF